MLSRQVMLSKLIKPVFCFKVYNVAHIHAGCSHNLKLNLLASKYLKNCRRNVNGTGQVRHESSASSIVHQTTSDPSSGLGPIPEPPVPLPEVTNSTIEVLTGEPTFSSLGLGGWWPAGWVQNAMEFLHVDLGLPWWGAVVSGTIILRLLMFPLVVLSQRNSAVMNNNFPQMQLLQSKLTDARQRGDKFDAARYSNEMMQFMAEKGFNPVKNLLPAVCQAPIFLSVFMGLRGMAKLPVESLRTGGELWFVDLTIPDQYYLLPIITSATLYLTIKLGVDTAQPSNNQVIMKYVMKGLPVLMIPFIINFPGLILVYWTTSNFVSLIQVGILKIPTVRDYCNIPKLIKHDASVIPVKKQGFVKEMKSAWANMKITSELEQRERVDRMAFLKAGRDPIKKTYKYDPTKVNPSSAAIQAKKRI